jgi:peptidoglycan/xylan/chitin deacetylase (PgdA/CDA1 family)
MQDFADKMRRRAGRWLDRRPSPIRSERGVFSLSFDDFPATAWTEAGPILAEHGITATYYVCGGLMDGENLGLPQFSDGHLQAVHAAGHEIGCHTFEHVSTLRVSGAELDSSLTRNAGWLRERLPGVAMDTFAYPFGDCALGAKAIVADRFLCGRGVRDGVNAGRADRALLQAIGLESRRLPGYGLEALMSRAAEQRGWLIAYGHDVMDRPTPYGCTPDDLDRIIRLAKAAELEILPVAAAWRRVAA